MARVKRSLTPEKRKVVLERAKGTGPASRPTQARSRSSLDDLRLRDDARTRKGNFRRL